MPWNKHNQINEKNVYKKKLQILKREFDEKKIEICSVVIEWKYLLFLQRWFIYHMNYMDSNQINERMIVNL